MAQDTLPGQRFGGRPLWFKVLLVVDAFAFGGLAIWAFVLNVLQSKMVDPLRPGAIDLLVGLDHTFLPYWFGQAVVAILLAWSTAGAYIWLRTRWRVVPVLTLIVPILLMVWVMASRG